MVLFLLDSPTLGRYSLRCESFSLRRTAITRCRQRGAIQRARAKAVAICDGESVMSQDQSQYSKIINNISLGKPSDSEELPKLFESLKLLSESIPDLLQSAVRALDLAEKCREMHDKEMSVEKYGGYDRESCKIHRKTALKATLAAVRAADSIRYIGEAIASEARLLKEGSKVAVMPSLAQNPEDPNTLPQLQPELWELDFEEIAKNPRLVEFFGRLNSDFSGKQGES